ncbi:MAG: 1-phosphofructokinase [Lachnospira sp.]|nr:1-phosphofructokinase [Lachnospira sp.]
MIYTITFNPSIDYVVTVSEISYDDVNRAKEEYILPGGKGLNVSRVLYNLGIDNIATGIIAGFTGKEIVRMLNVYGLNCDFVEVNTGMSRINVKIKSDNEGEINGLGPVVDSDDVNALYKVIRNISQGDYLVLGGNVQQSVPVSIYKELTEYATTRGARCVVDATGELLSEALYAKPFLIKPNKIELEKFVGMQMNCIDDIIQSARILQKKGAANVLVSLADAGGVLVADNGCVYISDAPKGTVVNSVGAGDSMIAGFLAGLIKKGNYEDALRMGICAGSASTFSKELATQEEVDRLMTQVTINLM